MLVLLSSARRKRYRDDILRCLAAPAGTVVQFRYSQGIVEPRIWNEPGSVENKTAVVCSVDLMVVGVPCALIPVRSVTIERIYRHGSTMSVVLRMGELVLSDDPSKFTSEVNQKSGGNVPINRESHADAQGTDGFFFFDGGEIGLLKRETSLETWEHVVTQLSSHKGYDEEQFFWTVLGLTKEGGVVRRDRFVAWDDTISGNHDYSLLVYVFHPKLDRWDPKLSRLRLTAQPEISSSYPLDVTIDSPYDVKEWRFRMTPRDAVGDVRGWLRIGPVTQPSGEPEWEIDLPLRIVFAWPRFILSVVLIGLLLATPVVIGYWLQSIPLSSKLIVSALAVVLGLAAAFVAGLGIKKSV